jgi:hypothetical protein
MEELCFKCGAGALLDFDPRTLNRSSFDFTHLRTSNLPLDLEISSIQNVIRESQNQLDAFDA